MLRVASLAAATLIFVAVAWLLMAPASASQDNRETMELSAAAQSEEEQAAFDRLTRTRQAYESFLQEFPDGPHASEVRARLATCSVRDIRTTGELRRTVIGLRAADTVTAGKERCRRRLERQCGGAREVADFSAPYANYPFQHCQARCITLTQHEQCE